MAWTARDRSVRRKARPVSLPEDAARLLARIASGAVTPADYDSWKQAVADTLVHGVADTGPNTDDGIDAAASLLAEAILEEGPLAASAAALAAGSLVRASRNAPAPRHTIYDALTDRLVQVCVSARCFIEAANDELLWRELPQRDPGAVEAHRSLPQWVRATIEFLRVDPGLIAETRVHLPLVEQLHLLADDEASIKTLMHALHAVHDEELVVLYPPLSRGWRVRLFRVANNQQLQVLLAHALMPVPEGEVSYKGPLGRRPDAVAVAAAAGSADTTESVPVVLPWALYTWHASALDLAEPDGVPNEITIPDASQPAHIPELKGERILLLGPPSVSRNVPLGPLALGGPARIDLVATLESEEVEDLLDHLAERTRAAEAEHAALEALRLADGPPAP